MNKKLVPNYFIGIKMSHSVDLVQQISLMQSEMASRIPSKCFTSPQKAHFTCFVLTLETDVEKALAIDTIHQSKAITDEICVRWRRERQTNGVQFGRISSFGHRVIFVEPVDDISVRYLTELTMTLHARCLAAGLIKGGEQNDTWKAHVTIAKTSKLGKKQKKTTINKDTYLNLQADLNVVAELSTVDLLSMREVEADGYYKSFASLIL